MISKEASEGYQVYLRDKERYLFYPDRGEVAMLSVYFELRREIICECVPE